MNKKNYEARTKKAEKKFNGEDDSSSDDESLTFTGKEIKGTL